MKFKLTAIGIATAAGLTLFGGVAAPTFAAADATVSPAVAVAEEAPRPGCIFPFDRPFPWSQVGIVDDAARVIGMPKYAVCERLDNGRSLLEIANAHGVSERELKAGILAGQWNDLVHRARNTDFTMAQAVRYYEELVAHIDVIINHHS
jgi:hypothetical protein